MTAPEHRLAGRTVWVVGASSGIGAALAKELVDRGARVAISARRQDELDGVAEGRMTVAPVDVTDREDFDAAATRIRHELGDVDTVIFNAGFWQRMDATAWDRDVFARHVDVNLLEALRIALAEQHISVITVCPGFVRTDLTAGNTFPMPFMIEADEAARSICNGLERGRLEIVFPTPMAALMKIARFVPVRLWAAAMGRTTKSSKGAR